MEIPPDYIFDTDFLSAAIRGRLSRRGLQRLRWVPEGDRFTTSVTVGEIFYGARKAGRLEWIGSLRRLLITIEVLPFDLAAAEEYAVLRVHLETSGTPLADSDLRIAAIALVTGRTLVTGNVRHFERVPNLRVESWLAEDSGSEVQP
jgi:predicted nucleic acid-binding protein